MLATPRTGTMRAARAAWIAWHRDKLPEVPDTLIEQMLSTAPPKKVSMIRRQS